jgi:methanethiol S-methyltransferase
MILSPLIIMSAVLIYGGVHSILASLSAKAKAKEWLGPRVWRVYRFGYNLFSVVSFLPVLALPAILPDRSIYAIPPPWAFINLGGQVLALGILVAGLLQTNVWSFLGVRQLVDDRESEEETLVVNGLYHWVRHPLYSAGLLFIWLIPLMTVNLMALNIGLTAYIVIGAVFEERKLRVEFGEAYERYQARTPMLIPRIWRKFWITESFQ